MVRMISDYSRRPFRALMADGLNDIVMGFWCLYGVLQSYNGILMGAAIHATLQHDYSMQKVLAISHHFERINLSLFLLPFIPALFIEPVRRRFVYPRTGYILLGGPKDRRVQRAIEAILMITLVVGLFFGLMMWLMHNSDSWSITQIYNMVMMILGAGFASIFGFLYLRFGFVRHVIIASISIITAVLLITTPIDLQYRYIIFWFVLMISTMSAGIDAFMKVLRIPVATEHDVE